MPPPAHEPSPLAFADPDYISGVLAAAGFVVLNAAAWVAFWVWISGRAGEAWKKVAYDVSLPPD